MSKEFDKIKEMMAQRMSKSQYRIHTGSKKLSQDLFRAKVNKKKMPNIPLPQRIRHSGDSEYRRMPLEKFLKAHPEWEV